jgi:hypothetical protein
LLNRFSFDVETVDEDLMDSLVDCVETLVAVLMVATVVVRHDDGDDGDDDGDRHHH